MSTFQRPARGFTLIEMMMVIVIIAVAAVLVFVNLGSLIPSERIKKAATGIGTTLELARSEAVSHGVIYGIIYDLDKNTYWLLVPPSETGEEGERLDFDDDNEDVRQTVGWTELPDDVEFIDVQLGQNTKRTSGRVRIEITPLGTASGHIVHLRNGETKQEFSISLNALTALVSVYERYQEFEEVIDYEE